MEEIKPEVKVEEPKVEVKYNETEQRAIEQGWKPKDQWEGDEADWVSAKAFLKFGEVQSELKRVRSEATQKEKVIKAMKDYHLNVKEDAKKEVIESLKKQKQIAIRDEDYQKAAQLDAQMEEIVERVDKTYKKSDEQLQQIENQPVGPPPEFFEWNKKNSWYRYGDADEITQEADMLAIGYANKHPTAAYTDVLGYVEKQIKKMYPEKFDMKGRASAVDEGGSTAPQKNDKKIRLTEAEKRAAEEFGLSYEAYAKSLQEYDRMKGRG